MTIQFEDSYIIDKESERERDRQDVRDGFMQKWEYRMKWFGEDEETAKRWWRQINRMRIGWDLARRNNHAEAEVS